MELLVKIGGFKMGGAFPADRLFYWLYVLVIVLKLNIKNKRKYKSLRGFFEKFKLLLNKIKLKYLKFSSKNFKLLNKFNSYEKMIYHAFTLFINYNF